MLLYNQHPLNKSIMIGVLGVPNAGKSSLINELLGLDLSIVTNRPQTTRNKFHCTFTIDHTEVILVDTPGIHSSNQEINKRMHGQTKDGGNGTDINIFLVDPTRSLQEQIKTFKQTFDHLEQPIWMIFTKCDLLPNWNELPLGEFFNKAKEELPHLQRYFVISSKTGENIHDLTGAICDHAQSGPHHYPDGRISNKNERFFVAEYIREQAFLQLEEELPYELAVTIEEFKANKKFNKNDPKAMVAKISASILVNRPSQRAIIIGHKGQKIRDIGQKSREKIEKLLGGPVYLNLHVKVSPKWFKNNFVLEEIGLPRTESSNRVWRKRA